MNVLLLNPDDRNPKSNVPWGVLSVGSFLRRQGHDVRLVDASVDGEAQFFKDLPHLARGAQLIGITVMSRFTPFLKRAADEIKAANPTCYIVAGGPHAILCPEQTVAYPSIDFVAYGEGELTMVGLIAEIGSGRRDFSKISGLVYKDADGQPRRTPPSAPAPFYDTDYDLLDPRVRATFSEYIQVLSGRGCSYKCTFCFNAVRGEKWRPRPADELVAELEKVVERYNPKVVYFRDENFFQGKQRTRDFIRLYRERGFTFRWRANCRVDYLNSGYINPDLLREIAEVRCEAMKFGLESGSERVLAAIKKNLRIAKVKQAILWLSAEPAIRKYYSFLIGMPGETVADYKLTMRLVGWAMRTDPQAKLVGPQYFRVYPGGELYDQVQKDWGYKAPQSLDEWCGIYNDPDNDDGWDKGVDYPWIPPEGRWLAKHASNLVDAYRRIYSSDSVVTWSPLKRAVLRLLQLSLDARFRYGFFGWGYEYRLIGWLTSLYGVVKRVLVR